jgi:hypothetical protein
LPVFGFPLCLHAHLQVPAFKNNLLLGLTLHIFLDLGFTLNGFTDEPFSPLPSGDRGGQFGVEDSFISFLPDCPKCKSREQLPDALENWVVEGDCFPIN